MRIKAERGETVPRGIDQRGEKFFEFPFKMQDAFKMSHDLALMLATLALVLSSSSKSLDPPKDVRAALLDSAEKSDPDQPDGRTVLLTHFSHLGRLTTSKGKTIYVADRRAVIAGMLAPARPERHFVFRRRVSLFGKSRLRRQPAALVREGQAVFVRGLGWLRHRIVRECD